MTKVMRKEEEGELGKGREGVYPKGREGGVYPRVSKTFPKENFSDGVNSCLLFYYLIISISVKGN